MRIGIDARLFSESGVGRYTRNLIEQLQILDHRNHYVLFVRSRDYQNVKCQMSNVKWKIIQTNIRWHTLEEQLKFPTILKKERLDLVHFPYFSVPIFYNKPFVVTIHDLIIHHFPTGIASTLPLPLYQLKLIGYKFIISSGAKKAKKIFTVSQATKEEIMDHLGVDSDKVVVTHEGVSNEITNPKSQIPNKSQNTKYSISNTQYFLYVGNAYPHKNLERLIEAFKSFCHPEQVSGSQSSRASDLRQNDTKLALVGKEDYFYKRLKRRVKEMSLERSVLFYGEASDEELSVLYKNALALVMPSLMEGFGLPALEAMVNKCLVLASDTPSLKEICGDAAIFFDPYNPIELAQKMEAIRYNDTYHYSDMIKKGFKRTKMFSWEKMARETLKVYES